MAFSEQLIMGAYNGHFKISDTIMALAEKAFLQNATVQGLQAGRLVSIDADGDVQLATGHALGVLVKDADYASRENIPVLASGRLTAISGGSLITTDQVVEENVTAGAALYANAGMFTTVAPQALTLTEGTPNTIENLPSPVVGYAITANSSSDKSLQIHVVV